MSQVRIRGITLQVQNHGKVVWNQIGLVKKKQKPESFAPAFFMYAVGSLHAVIYKYIIFKNLKQD